MNAQVRRLAIACALPGALLAAGCGQPERPFGDVEGKVTLNGQPLANIQVQFMPDTAQGTTGPTSEAITDDQGRYRLRSSPVGKRQSRDGALVGWHLVVLTDLSQSGTPQGATPPPPRLPNSYTLFNATPLKFEVQAGSQTINIEVEPQ